MSHELFAPEVREMLANQDYEGLRSLCETLHPATVAEAMKEGFEPDEIWQVLSTTDLRTQALIFEYLPITQQVELVEGKARPQVGKLIERMSHDDRVDLLQRLPPRVKESLLRLVDEAERRDIATLVTYREGSVGSLMTTDYAWIPPSLTASEAIDQLRQQAPDKETIYYVYVLDEPRKRPESGLAPRKLLGVISLRDLILAPRQALVRDLMEEEIVTLHVEDDRRVAAEVLARYDFIALPVVDDDGGMVGIITHDDIIDVIQQEATGDLQRQAGIGPIEGSYLEARFSNVWYNRAKWLLLLFVLQTGTVYVMNRYEDKLTIAALVTCLPLVLSVGGNSGSQAATLVVRALALEEIVVRDWYKVLGRELLMGGALASVLGVTGLIRTYFATPPSLVDGPNLLTKLTIVLGLSVALACLWGTLLGSMLPIFFRWLGFDPALISSPAIATLSDVSGIIIYANVAILIFGLT